MPADRTHLLPVRGVFVVGCPRSGSTLLQSMLAQHRKVLSFPETHYFQKVRGRLDGHSPRLVSPRAAARTLASLHDIVGSRQRRRRLVPPTFAGYTRAFARVVGEATAAQGCPVWVEKSPVHLHAIEQVSPLLPTARWVHILRDGRDVAASMYDLCLTDPERWVPQVLGRGLASEVETEQGRARILDGVVDRWNRDVAISRALEGSPGHTVVHYGALVTDPQGSLEQLCEALDLDFAPAMLRHWEAAPTVVGFRGHAPHMQRPFQPITPAPLAKFERVFDGAQRRRVLDRLTGGGELVAETPPRPA